MRNPAVARLAGLAAGLALVTVAAPARALLFTLSPRIAAGVTSNAYGVSDNETAKPYRDVFGSFGVNGTLVSTWKRSNHRLGYGFNTTRYFTYGGADITSHDGVWASTFNLTPRLTLGVGANAALFRASAVAGVDPLMPNAGLAIIPQAPVSILTTSFGQSLTYDASGVEKYSQALSVSWIRSLGEGTNLPQLLSINANGRRDRTFGRDTYSVSLTVGDFFRLDTPTDPTVSNGHILNGTLLGGWRRDFSLRTSLELQAGALVLYGIETKRGAIGPSVVATLSYRAVPWYATLIVAQQPSLNIYIGEALISDAVTGRIAMPLDRRETNFIAGFGTYTVARRVTAEQRANFERVYDLVSLGASLLHRFERWPIGVALDYTISSQRGSLHDTRYYPSSARSTLGLSVGGQFAWGEGNSGWARPR